MLRNKLKMAIKVFGILGVLIGASYAGVALADSSNSALSMSDLQSNLQSTFTYGSKIVSAACLVAGIFLGGGVFPFMLKKHSDMKMQGQPKLQEAFVIGIVAVCLLAVPVVLNTATTSVFGSGAVSSVDGSSMSGLIQGS